MYMSVTVGARVAVPPNERFSWLGIGTDLSIERFVVCHKCAVYRK